MVRATTSIFDVTRTKRSELAKNLKQQLNCIEKCDRSKHTEIRLQKSSVSADILDSILVFYLVDCHFNQDIKMSNIIHPKIKNLSTLQLKYLYEHLRLGEQHLRKILDKEQFKQLLRLNYLNPEEKENIYPDKAEKTGNITFIINTIITGIFGAWLGLAGFTELKLTSYTALFSITTLTASLSGILGYYSFKQVQTDANSAVIKQKLLKLQIDTMSFVNQKYDESITATIKKINAILKEFDSNAPLFNKNDFSSEKQLSVWFENFTKMLQKEERICSQNKSYQFYAYELNDIKNNVKKIIFSKRKMIRAQTDNPNYIDILTRPEAATPKQPALRKSWLKGNLTRILVNLVPVLIGSFGSMFVFLTGTPSLSKEFGAHQILQAITSPTARVIEFLLAIALTLYYGFSNVYNFRKTFKRNDELEKTYKQIINQETESLETNAKLSMLKKINHLMKRLKATHNILQTTIHNSKKNHF